MSLLHCAKVRQAKRTYVTLFRIYQFLFHDHCEPVLPKACCAMTHSIAEIYL